MVYSNSIQLFIYHVNYKVRASFSKAQKDAHILLHYLHNHSEEEALGRKLGNKKSEMPS